MFARRPMLAAMAAVAVVAIPTVARAEYIVDNFTTPDSNTTFAITSAGTNPYTRSDTLSTGTSMERTRDLTITSNPVFSVGGVSGWVGPDPDGMFGNGLGVFSGRSKATTTLGYTFANPTDFTGIPNAGVVLTFADSDQNMPFMVTLGDTNGGTATGTAQTMGSPGVYYIPFTELTGTVDFSQIDSLDVVINGNPGSLTGTDYVLTEVKIAPVPAPAGVVLGLAALPVVGLWRLRRRNA